MRWWHSRSFARAWTRSPKKKLQLGGGYENFDAEGKGGTLTVTARVSNGASRYAMPSPSISDFVYAALLYKDGERPENPSSEDFVEGVPNESDDKLIFSFQRPDETEGLTLEVFAFKDGTTNFSKDNALLSGKKTGLKVNGDKIEVVETIALEVNKSSTEKGTVSLQIKVFDDCSDCSLEIKELKNDGTIESNPHFAITGNAPNFTITQNGDDISAGTYKVTFIVKKVDDADDTKEEVIHIFTESINVLPGMCTDTWSGQGKGDAKEITQGMISTTVYVCGSDDEGQYWYAKNGYANITGDDTNSGTFLAPLATIQKAVDTIIARNDGSSDYTIYIDGVLKYEKTDENTTYIGKSGMADFSALKKNLKLTIKALSDKATLDGGARFDADGNVETGGIEKCIINARSDTNDTLKLTLENLDITGGGNTGVWVDTGSALTMKGCTISKNSASHRGGGVYVYNGTFTMESGTISDNKATLDCGGGVYVISGGTFTMTGGKITGNTAKSNGGGVYVYGGTFTMTGGEINKNNTTNGNGAGVYIFESGTFTMQGGVISENSTSRNAGGVFVNNSAFIMEDGTISKNEASYGGGIYLYRGGTFTMEKGSVSGNKALGETQDDGTINGGNGGGVYVPNGHAFTMKGGTISDCTATAFGGGIYSEGTLTITGGTISKCIATTSGGGIYNNVSDTSVISTITNCTITGCKMMDSNDPNGGGGIYNNAGTLIINEDTTIIGCTAGQRGGGIYNAADAVLTMNGGTITSNTSKWGGGGIYNNGTFTLGGGVISENTTTTGSGGGICDGNNGILTINSGIVSKNRASANSGGGIYSNSNRFVIKGGAISDNKARNGGGIYLQGGLTIEGGEITNNTVTGIGGGLLIFGRLDINGGTISGNTAGTYGGGIYYQAGTQTITGGTIENNQASSGSGIYNDASLKLQGGTISGDVCLNNSTNSLTLLDNAVITNGVIDLTEFTDSSEAKRVVYIGGTLMQNFVAKIKLGTAYQLGDTILGINGYTLTEQDCKRFSIDGDTYDIALSDGKGVLVAK